MPHKRFSFHEFAPEDVWQWKIIEEQMDRVLSLYDYEEIRLSVLQDYKILSEGLTALMPHNKAQQLSQKTLNLRGPNDDVSLISLRPEGTISVLHYTAGVFDPGHTHKFFYHGPMFRLDELGNPMEFYQLGIELLGDESILGESELISMGFKLCQSLGLGDVTLKLNSYGCPNCRTRFFEELKYYLESRQSELCAKCFSKLSISPFEDTGCESPKCTSTILDGPKITDYLCESCRTRFSKQKKIQANLGHRYKVEPHLTKHFSYYNGTVFDFVIKDGKKEIQIGGGGRYDNLAELITNKFIPAVGFYLNMDVIFDIIKNRALFSPKNGHFSVYLLSKSPQMEEMMLQIVHELHSLGVRTVLDNMNDSFEDQIARARNKDCSLLFALKEENIRDGKILLYNLFKDHQEYIPLSQIGDAVLLARKALNNE